MPEVGVAELALDDQERNAFVGQLEGVRVAELVRAESPADAGDRRRVSQLRASGRDGPAPAARRSGDVAEQRPDREFYAGGEPRLQLLPGPVVHADLAAAAALAAAHQHGAAPRVKIRLGEGERLADTQSGAPQHDDQSAQALPMNGLAGGAHDGDDLLDGGRVRRLAHPLLARPAASVETGQRGGRAATTGGIEQALGHLVPPSDSDLAIEHAGLADGALPPRRQGGGRAGVRGRPLAPSLSHGKERRRQLAFERR
jgi:hypothetical protein